MAWGKVMIFTRVFQFDKPSSNELAPMATKVTMNEISHPIDVFILHCICIGYIIR